MRPLSANDILSVWEWGEAGDPVDRALTLLAASSPEAPEKDLVGVSLGERDARLLDLRALTFGETLDGYAECPQCGERLEFDLDVGGIRLHRLVEAEGLEHALTAAGVDLRFRLPTSQDLYAVAQCGSVDAGRNLLVKRCVTEAVGDGGPIDWSDLSPEVVTALAARMAECDPQAEVLLNLTCPACGHAWRLLLDIASFFWGEIQAQAKRLVCEVDALARAYGWREADILSMTAGRRRSYLELATG